MTKIAIVGAGILGRSLLYCLSKMDLPDLKVFLIDSDSFAKPCSFHSTAVASTRGTTKGLSSLGDLIVEGFEAFKSHVEREKPVGVYRAQQMNASSEGGENFLKRFPDSTILKNFKNISFMTDYYASTEEAFVIRPETYLEWLLYESKKKIEVTEIHDFVVDYKSNPFSVELKTQNGIILTTDRLIFTGGVYNRFWNFKGEFPHLEKSKTIQGSYLYFPNVDSIEETLSLTMDGYNLVYRKESRELLLGASSDELTHELPQTKELKEIYAFFQNQTNLVLPNLNEGQVLVGSREKSSKRSPYVLTRDSVCFAGGMYKNGYSLSYFIANKILSDFIT